MPHNPFTPADGTRWRHSKTGNSYNVITCARMEKTGEWVVVYKPAEHRNRTFVRPVSEWFELVTVEGVRTDRFVPIITKDDDPMSFYVEREPYGDEAKWAAR